LRIARARRRAYSSGASSPEDASPDGRSSDDPRLTPVLARRRAARISGIFGRFGNAARAAAWPIRPRNRTKRPLQVGGHAAASFRPAVAAPIGRELVRAPPSAPPVSRYCVTTCLTIRCPVRMGRGDRRRAGSVASAAVGPRPGTCVSVGRGQPPSAPHSPVFAVGRDRLAQRRPDRSAAETPPPSAAEGSPWTARRL
jgi:hypothetical protein